MTTTAELIVKIQHELEGSLRMNTMGARGLWVTDALKSLHELKAQVRREERTQAPDDRGMIMIPENDTRANLMHSLAKMTVERDELMQRWSSLKCQYKQLDARLVALCTQEREARIAAEAQLRALRFDVTKSVDNLARIAGMEVHNWGQS